MVRINKSQICLNIMLMWALLSPGIHYYFSEIQDIFAGVSLSGCIDVFMFTFGLCCFILLLLKYNVIKPFLWCPVLFYIGAKVYSLLISSYMDISIRAFVVSLVPILFYLNLTMMKNRCPNLSQKLVHTVILSSLFPMAIAFLGMIAPFSSVAENLFALLPSEEFATEPYPGLGVPRAYGSMVNPNEFAVFMAVIFLAVLLKLDNSLSSKKRKAWLVVGSAVIIMTFTRSVWLTLSVVLIILITIYMDKKARLPALIMVVLGVIIIVLTPISEYINERLHETATLSDRAELRDTAIEFIRENPIGSGLGTSQTITVGVQSKFVIIKGDIIGGWGLHNEYLTHAVEGGVILLLAYLILLISFLRLATRVFFCAKSWGLWLGATTVMLGGIALTDTAVGYGSFAFWLLVAGVEIEYQSYSRTIEYHEYK